MITTKIENKDLQQTVEVTKRAGEITENALVHHAQEVQKTQKTFDEIERAAEARITEINRQAPVPKPVTSGPVEVAEVLAPLESQPTAKEQQVSEVRLNSLWQSYCVAAPGEPACKESK